MKVIVDTSFEKDLNKVSDKKLRNLIADCIEQIELVTKLSDIANCKKLKGSKNAYQIKIGNYRIGFLFENNNVDLIRFLHRKDIYNFFPR
jgi:mRNA interferase RelE/StbE